MILFLLLVWFILNGGINAELTVFGLLCVGLVYVFMWKFLGYTPATDRKLILGIPWVLAYIVNLIVEIAKAALNVMEVSFNPSMKPDPVIVDFHSGLKKDYQNVLLANSITLTPGTITVFQDGDYFVVHCLREEYSRGLGESSFIRLLRRF